MQALKANRYWAAAVASAALSAVLVSGCGVRSGLDYPNAEKPNKSAAANTGSTTSAPTETATAESGQGKPEGAAPKPHKGFILDGLIR